MFEAGWKSLGFQKVFCTFQTKTSEDKKVDWSWLWICVFKWFSPLAQWFWALGVRNPCKAFQRKVWVAFLETPSVCMEPSKLCRPSKHSQVPSPYKQAGVVKQPLGYGRISMLMSSLLSLLLPLAEQGWHHVPEPTGFWSSIRRGSVLCRRGCGFKVLMIIYRPRIKNSKLTLKKKKIFLKYTWNRNEERMGNWGR